MNCQPAARHASPPWLRSAAPSLAVYGLFGHADWLTKSWNKNSHVLECSGRSEAPALCGCLNNSPIQGWHSMKSVLLVDDDSAILLGTGVRMRSMGYTVYTAEDAVNAVSAVRKNEPDVVVLDISLPAGDGFLVADRLHNLDGSAATPIIFITASDNPALR